MEVRVSCISGTLVPIFLLRCSYNEENSLYFHYGVLCVSYMSSLFYLSYDCGAQQWVSQDDVHCEAHIRVLESELSFLVTKLLGSIWTCLGTLVSFPNIHV